MVGTEHSIVGQVYAAKTDPEAADALIGQYMGFIRSETVKFIHAAPEDGHEDELSIAMLAFYEAVLSYEKGRGAFLPYAARAIRNRLIDHYRTEKRHGNVISLHAPAGGEEESGRCWTPCRTTGMRSAPMSAHGQPAGDPGVRRPAGPVRLSFSDVADNCPRQDRTLAACRRVLDYARANPELLNKVAETGKLPMNELALGSGTERKTLERHRKYLVAILLAFTNGYEIIRGHLCQMAPARGRERK